LKIQENIQKYITFFNAFNLKKSSEKIDFVKGENKKDLKTLGGSLISNDMSISLKDKLAFIDQIIGNEEMHPEYSSAFLLGIVKKNSPLINPYDQIRLKAAAAKKIVQLEQSLEHMIIANHHIAKMGVGIDASLSLEAVDVLIQKDVPLSLILPLLQDIQILGKVQDERFDPLVLFNRMHGGILQNKMKYHTSEIDRLEKMGVSMDCIFPYFCQTQENEQGLIRHNRALNQEYEGGRDVFNLRKTIEVRKKAGQRLEDLGSHQKLPAEILEENLQKLSLEVADNIWFCPKDRMLAIENLIEGGMAPNEAVPLLLKLIKYENQQMKFSHHAFNISDAKIKALKRLDQFKDHTDEFLQVHECLAQSKSFCALERLESVQVLLEHHHSKADLIPILKDISQNGCVWDPSLSMDHQKTADAKQKAGVMHQDLMRDLVCPKKEI
jgi:hypothetical protein